MPPYIIQDEREVWDKLLAETLRYLGKPGFATAGDLNYLMTKLAHAYVQAGGLNYHNLNSIVGVFESAKAEFQRRVVGPYEDRKIELNGDVLPFEEEKPKENNAQAKFLKET